MGCIDDLPVFLLSPLVGVSLLVLFFVLFQVSCLCLFVLVNIYGQNSPYLQGLLILWVPEKIIHPVFGMFWT